MHLHNYFQAIHYTLRSFANFLPEQLNLEGQWEVENSEISYTSMYQNVTEGKFMFFDWKNFKVVGFVLSGTRSLPFLYGYCWSQEKNFFQERHIRNESSITVKVSRITQKNGIYIAKGGFGPAFSSTDLGHIFGSSVDNEYGVMLRGEGPKIAPDIVRIHPLVIYVNLIEYEIVVDTTTLLLRCFSFISKPKAGDNKTTGQYTIYRTFNNLQLRPILKNLFS